MCVRVCVRVYVCARARAHQHECLYIRSLLLYLGVTHLEHRLHHLLVDSVAAVVLLNVLGCRLTHTRDKLRPMPKHDSI